MKKTQILAACTVFLFMLGVTACGTDAGEPVDAEDSVPAETTVYEEVSENIPKRELTKTPVEPITVQDASLYFNGISVYLEEEQKDELSEIYSSLMELSWQEMTLYEDSMEWRMTLNRDRSLSRMQSADGWVIMDDTMRFYADNDALNEFIIKALASGMDDISVGTEEYFSISCSEPDTEDEYRETAEQLLEAWLTSLQDEETEDYYRNTGFTISEPEILGSGYISRKNNYLACGMVNGVKEFCVELCFTAEDCGDNTFYDRYYQEGRYTVAGTHWSGNYICGRFRWENGICTLIDLSTRDGSGRMLQGLNGISQNEFRNFYDFARQPDLNRMTDDSFQPYGKVTVSSNLTMTMDGRQIHIDVYSFDARQENADTVTAVMHKRSYTESEFLYSSGVYYTDNAASVKELTLPRNFKITFDNYDNDGNPDYCVKYDEDENGSYYVLQSLQTDGRIFNLSGRAYSGGIYVAGCYEASPRLQRTEDIPYIGWKYEKGSYYPTDTSGRKIELPAVHMYSDRYFLPDDMKIYDEDENIVHCFLWNNTDKKVSTDSVYSVEMCENGEWVTVADGLRGSTVSIEPRSYADIAYDISAVTNRANTTYRIVQNCGRETAYGNFWLAGRAVQTMQLDSVTLAEGALAGAFAYTDSGLHTSPVTSAVITSGSATYSLLLTDSELGTQEFLMADGRGLPAGNYTLTADGRTSMDFMVETDVPVMGAAISAEQKDSEVQVTFTPKQDCYLTQMMLYWMRDEQWQMTMYSIDGYSYAGYGLKKAGRPLSLTLTNVFSGQFAEYMYESLKEYYETYDELPEGYEENGIVYEDGMTFEEFQRALAENNAIQADDSLLIVTGVTDKDGNGFIIMTKME